MPNLLKKVVGQAQPSQGCSGFELPMEVIGNVPELDHLRHANNISASDAHIKMGFGMVLHGTMFGMAGTRRGKEGLSA
jgi:hypothetical protein